MSRKRKRSLILRRLTILGLLGAGIVVIFGGVLWIQEAPLREAEQRLNDGDHQAAIALIRSWEKTNSSNGRSQALMARCLADSGDFQRAINIFESVGAENAVEIHAWARAYLSLQRWSNALPLLRDLRNRDREDADVIHELAACSAKLGMLEEALKTAEEFRSHEAYAHRAWLLIGVIQTQRENKSAAVDAWMQIEKYDPDYKDLQLPPEDFLTQFASLRIELGQVAEASVLLEKALSIHETAEAQFQAGLAADLSGDQAKAKARWQRSIALDPGHRNARESLARLSIASGDAKTAQEVLEPIVGLDSTRSSTTFLMERVAQLMGDSAQVTVWQQRTEKLRKREAIDSAVNQLLTEDPDSYWSLVARSYQFAERGNFQQAQQLLDRVHEDNEDPFVAELRKALVTRGKLPEKDQFPIKQF